MLRSCFPLFEINKQIKESEILFYFLFSLLKGKVFPLHIAFRRTKTLSISRIVNLLCKTNLYSSALNRIVNMFTLYVTLYIYIYIESIEKRDYSLTIYDDAYVRSKRPIALARVVVHNNNIIFTMH